MSNPQPRGGAGRPPGTLKIGSIAGVDVLVRSSWLILAVLIAVIMAPAIDSVSGIRRGDPVANAMAGLDVVLVERLVDYCAQAVDMHPQGIGIGQFFAPYAAFQILPGDHRRRGFHQGLQDFECGGVELYGFTLAVHFQRFQIEFQLTHIQHTRRQPTPAPG